MSADTPLVRPARRDELLAIQGLLREIYHDTFDAILGAAEVNRISERWHSLANLEDETRREAHSILVLEASGELCATGSATLLTDQLLRIARLYVAPAKQGLGFGSALLQALALEFPQARELTLEVEPRNLKARAFYRSRGFAEAADAANCDGQLICRRAVAGLPGRERSYLRLRAVRNEDAQELFGLIALCFAAYHGCYVDPHDDLHDLLAPAEHMTSSRGRFWVVEDWRGMIGACLSLDFPGPGLAELHRVYVRPDLRRRGLASRLVVLAEREALEEGAGRMVLWSDTRFTDAHRLYERLGYRNTGGERALGDISHSREYSFEKTLR